VAIATCNGDLYVAENDSLKQVAGHVIRKIGLADGWVSTIAGSADLAGDRDGAGTAARFDSPEGIACDGQSLYVADTRNHLVRQIVLATGRVTTLAGVSGEAGAVDGVGAGARLNYPRGLVFDPVTGDLLVADRDENVLRRIE
jgi:DNA-binding beta-propeller fold protein YncE